MSNLNRSWRAHLRHKLAMSLTVSWEQLCFYKECVILLFAIVIGVIAIVIRSDIHPWISQHMIEFISATLVILMPGIGWAVKSASTRRKEKKEIEETVSLAFIDVASLTPHYQLSEDELVLFYSGEKLHQRFWDVIKGGFDFRRSALSSLEQEFARWDGKKFYECKTPIGDRQGKSLLMGRFAWNLAESSDNKVLWWLGEKEYPANVELALWLSKYKKILSRTKKLIVFMDDLFPEEREDWGLDDLDRSSAYHFLQTINRESIFIVYPSKQKGQLTFQVKDRVLLLEKLTEKGLIDKSFAERFANDVAMQKLYKDQLRLCLNSIAEMRHFMPKAPRNILSRELSAEEDEALKKVSVCSTVSLPYPQFALRNKSVEFWRSMKLGGLKNLLEEVEWETGQGFYDLNVKKKPKSNGYVLIGPLFGKYILRERCRIEDFKTLLIEYEKTLLEILSSAQDPSETEFAWEYVRVALCRLAKNMQRPFYPEFTGSVLAHEVFAYPSFKENVTQCLENLSDLSQILRWAFTMRKLQNRRVANRLFEKADATAQKRGTRELDLKQVIYLAIGLKDSHIREQKKRATIYFDNAVKRMIKEGTSKIFNHLIDAYVELINSISGPKKALYKLDDLVKLGGPGFKADAVLIRRKAELLDQLPNLIREAQEEFKRAIKLAREDPSSTETLIINLQRYAHFLSQRNEQLDPALREDPEVYFKEATERAKDSGFSYEAVLNAWAANKERRGDMKGARTLYENVVEYCNEQGIINPPSLLGLARFLHKYGQLFKDKAYVEWWQTAEDCCRKVINYEGTDRLSRLHAYHQLGLLMGSNPPKVHKLPNGSNRPDFRGAIEMLEKAFESSEPQRMDDSQKTFQDCVTHKALAQTYMRWVKAIETESVDQLLKKAEFHSLKSFSGLSQRSRLTTKMKEHIIDSQIEYAGFQWFRNRDLQSAQANYEEAIKNLENWGLSDRNPELACKSYWYAANLYSYQYKKSGFEKLDCLDYSEQLYKKALQRITDRISRQKRSQLRYRAVVCLYQQMWSCHAANKMDAEKQKHHDASLIVKEGLAEDPRNSYLWSAKILLHIWENNLDLAMQQLIGHELSTVNQCLKTLIGSNRQAARNVAENLKMFQTELKNKLLRANIRNQCSFHALLSVLNPHLGSLILSDKRIFEDLRKRLNSATATRITQIIGLLKKASRIREFSDLCLSLDSRRIINSSTLTSNYRLLARLEKDVKAFAKCFVKALPDANWADLIVKEDASLYRLNGIIDIATKVEKSEAVRLIESLSNLHLNPLFLRVDLVSQGKGYTQARVVNLFLSGRISISPRSATRIVSNIHDQEWLYLINSASVEQGFWLLWNIYRFAPERAKNLAKQVAVQLESRMTDEPLMIRTALAGLLHLCNIETGDMKQSKADMTTFKQALKQYMAEKKLTLLLLSLTALKVKLEPEQFKEVKEAVDEVFIKKTIRDNKDQNLRELLTILLVAAFRTRC